MKKQGTREGEPCHSEDVRDEACFLLGAIVRVEVNPNTIHKMTHQDDLKQVANAPEDNERHGQLGGQAHGPGSKHSEVEGQDAELRCQGCCGEEDLEWEDELQQEYSH